METEKKSHPTARQLAAFALGKLAPDGRAKMQEHVAGCATCATFLSKTPRDTLLGLLRQAAAEISAADQSTPALRGSSTLASLALDGVPGAQPNLNPQPHADQPQNAGPGAAAPGAPPAPAGAANASADDADIPQALREQTKYRVTRLLGRGGMGSVYEAYHARMDRRVAIKVINPALVGHPDALKRFDQEVRAAARVEHENVARAYDAEEIGTLRILVMEFVAGQSLDKYLAKNGPLSVMQACRIVHQALIGLNDAHKHGMVHRDLKPQNLMFTSDGKVKILDFGLAKLASERQDGDGLTGTNAFMGTPHYLAPEQAMDAAKADIRADIYSLGCTLYCLLAGSPPYGGASAVAIALAHRDQNARPLCEVRTDVPPELSRIVERMLAKNAADRPQTPAEAAQALSPFLKPIVPASPVVAAPVKPGPIAPATQALPAMATVEVPVGDDRPTIKSTRAAKVTALRTAEKLGNAGRLSWNRRNGLLIAAGVLALLLGIWGTTILFRTPAGTVVVENAPADAEVLVDGNQVTITRHGENGDVVTIAAVPQGEHRLKLARDGRTIWANDIKIDFAGQQISTRYIPPLGETAPAPVPSSSAAKKYESPKNARRVDLLALVDLKQDAVHGIWKKDGDALRSPEQMNARVEIPYSPPREYDLRMSFTPIPLLDGIGLICAASDRQFVGVVGNYGNSNCGFELYDGKLSNQNASANRKPDGWVRYLNRHVVIAQVRNDGATLYLDGASVSVARGPYSRLDLHENHKLRHNDAIGIVTAGLARVDEIEILEVTGTGKRLRTDDKRPVAAEAASPAKKYEPPKDARRVDLLALVDLKQDAVQRNWSREKSAVLSPSEFNRFNDRIEFPYAPPEEYDLRAEFVPLVDGKDVGLICRAGGTQFATLVGAYNNKICGFELFGGKLANVNTTAARRETGWLTKDRRHELVVQVRKDGAAIIVDGAVVCPPTIGYSRLSLDPSYRLINETSLGLISAGPVRFEKVEIIEVTGVGKELRASGNKSVSDAAKPDDLPVAMQKFREADVLGGDWRTEGDTIEQRSRAADSCVMAFGDREWTDYDLTLEAKTIKGVPDFAVFFQVADLKSWRQLRIGPNGNRTAEIALSRANKFEMRTVAQLDAPIALDRWYKIKIEVRKTQCRCEVGGKTLTSLDAGFIKGRVGLGTVKGSVAFRDIEVKSPDGSLLWKGPPRLPGQAGETAARTASLDNVPAAMQQFPMAEVVDGVWKKEGTEIVQPMSDARFSVLLFGDPDWRDYDYTVEGKALEGLHGVAFCFLANKAAKFCTFDIGDSKRSVFNSRNKRVERNGALERDRWYKVRVEVRGAEYVCFLDGEKLFAGTDPDITAGRVGLCSYHTSARYRNFKVTTPTGAVLWEGPPEVPGEEKAGGVTKDDPRVVPTNPLKKNVNSQSSTGFVPIFNGKSLDGWSVDRKNTYGWTTEDGAIVARASNVENRNWLLTNRDYADFILRLEFSLDAKSGGGVGIRAVPNETLPLNGKPSSIDHPVIKLGQGVGYTTGTTLWIQNLDRVPVPRPVHLLAEGQWNKFEATVRGRCLQTKINDGVVLDLTIAADAKFKGDTLPAVYRVGGRIGLQRYTGTIRYRNIEVKDLSAADGESSDADKAKSAAAPAADFVPIFNGRDLKGWTTHPSQPDGWSVNDGILIGQDAMGYLYTKRDDYADVHVRAEVRVNAAGNSGIYVRTPFGPVTPPKNPKFTSGYEAAISFSDRDARTGALYASNKVASRFDDQLTRPDEWFVLEVIAHDNRIKVLVNNKETALYVDSQRAHNAGRIALQLHDTATKVEFRKIEIKELPREPGGKT